MEEVFVELIVKRKTGLKEALLRALTVFVVLFAFLVTIQWGILGITITILLIYGAYLVWTYTSIEYEYSFLNGELTVDKIMGQRKRKTVDSYEIKEAELIAPTYSDEVIRRAGGVAKTLDYSSGYKTERLYSIIINNGKGATQVIFEPDDRIIDAMHHMRPSIVKKA